MIITRLLHFIRLKGTLSNLKLGSDKTREEAARRLGELRDSRSLFALLKALNDDSPSVMRAAAAALGMLGNVDAIEPLLESYNKNYTAYKEEAIKAISNLCPYIQTKRDTNLLHRLLDLVDQKNRTGIRKIACKCLVEYGDYAVSHIKDVLLSTNS